MTTINPSDEFNWLAIAAELKAISQAGKEFAKTDYEKERHERIEWIAAQILAKHTDLEADEIRMMLQQDCGYPTPKVDCRGVIFKDNKVLLVKEIADGGWTFPGGWCDIGMTASENVIREVREESGFEVRVVKLLAVFDRNTQGHTPPYPFDIYKLFFLCEIIGGQAKTSNETSDVQFFGEDEIPSLSRGRTLPHEIKRFFEHLCNPNLPTDYD
jgi:ADP-ribose pyrophosphatase YjhB (NUDIX family)